MHCSSCGAKLTESDQFCFRCGAAITPIDAAAPKPAPAGTQVPPPTTPTYTGDIFSYAGFWKRFAAWLLDAIIVIAISFVIGLALDFAYLFVSYPFFVYIAIIDTIVGFLIGILYYSIFESSTHQATPGKMALGIIVTDIGGQRISFARAVGRDLSKILSALILGIGFLMIGFTDEKRGLHDYIAGTLVINK